MWSSPGSPFWPRQCRNPLLLNEEVWVSVPFQGHWESGPPDTWSSLICEGIYGSSSSMQMESRCGPWSAWRLEQPAYGHLVTFGKTNQKSGEGRQSQFPFWELRLSLPTGVRFRRRLNTAIAGLGAWDWQPFFHLCPVCEPSSSGVRSSQTTRACPWEASSEEPQARH